jgi:hypothetical protein
MQGGQGQELFDGRLLTVRQGLMQLHHVPQEGRLGNRRFSVRASPCNTSRTTMPMLRNPFQRSGLGGSITSLSFPPLDILPSDR